MESVGSQLRQARQSLGLTLEQASAKTRISTKNLQAIEDDNLARIGSPFFYRSFVKQFAEYLNVDYSLVAAAVQKTVSTMPEPLMPGQVSLGQGELAKPKIAPLEVKRRPWNLRWLSSVLSFGIMLVACSSFYAVWQNSRSDWRASLAGFVHLLAPAAHGASVESAHQTLAQISAGIPQPPAQTPEGPSAGTQDSAARLNSTPAAPESAPSNTATPKASEPEPAFHIELSALERTWVSIVSDGTETFSGILDAAQTKVLEGHGTARIRTGSAGALSFVFNGKLIGTLRPRGQERTVVFTKDNYEVLEASPGIALARFSPSAE